ncbi:MAG: GtrA family protein [Acidihalobacter sp.]|uniref:GtrA family protein n=1 Tax=Acidihalobacter sp. TaxID=1872108 RepID=UPI00307E100A
MPEGRRIHVALRYAFFAAIATLANLLVQSVSLHAYTGPFALYAAMGVGTLAGLYVKYRLDKLYIFAYHTADLAHDVRTFALYVVMGGITTIVFWGSELGFEFALGGPFWRNFGAVLGLAIGYWVKYRLDKRFVFTSQRVPRAGRSAV